LSIRTGSKAKSLSPSIELQPAVLSLLNTVVSKLHFRG